MCNFLKTTLLKGDKRQVCRVCFFLCACATVFRVTSYLDSSLMGMD